VLLSPCAVLEVDEDPELMTPDAAAEAEADAIAQAEAEAYAVVPDPMQTDTVDDDEVAAAPAALQPPPPLEDGLPYIEDGLEDGTCERLPRARACCSREKPTWHTHARMHARTRLTRFCVCVLRVNRLSPVWRAAHAGTG
jgi:hypothetical protein